jgi:hypothetical protein
MRRNQCAVRARLPSRPRLKHPERLFVEGVYQSCRSLPVKRAAAVGYGEA